MERYGRYELLECNQCNLQFWNPREMPDGHWYEQMYGPRDAKLLPLEPGHKYFLADPLAPKSGQLFDVGCGTGNFLTAARSAGFQVTGTELDPGAVRFIQNQLHIENVFPLTITQFAQQHAEEKFDIVTFFEVLEHQADPASFLRSAKSCVKPKGFIALSVPNKERWLTGPDVLDYPPNHFLRWNATSLGKFLALHGLKVLAIREEAAGIAYAAQMINISLRTGLSRLIAGNVQPAFRETMQMPADQAASVISVKRTTRQKIFSALSNAKLAACYPAAFLGWPVIRIKKLRAAYLYCLAQISD